MNFTRTSSQKFSSLCGLEIVFPPKRGGKKFKKENRHKRFLSARNNFSCQRNSFPALNCLHEKFNAPAVIWHSAVKTAQNSAINRRHSFKTEFQHETPPPRWTFFLFFWRHDNGRRKMIFRGHDKYSRASKKWCLVNRKSTPDRKQPQLYAKFPRSVDLWRKRAKNLENSGHS